MARNKYGIKKANYGETPDGAFTKMALILWGIPVLFVIGFLYWLWS